MKFRDRAAYENGDHYRRGRNWHKLGLALAVIATGAAAVGAATGLLGNNSKVAGFFALVAAFASGILAKVDPEKKAKTSFARGKDYEGEQDYDNSVLPTFDDDELSPEDAKKVLDEVMSRFHAVRDKEAPG